MKIRYLLLIILSFLSFISVVCAHDYVAAEQSVSCFYRNGNNILYIEEHRVGSTPLLGTVKYYAKDAEENPYFVYNGTDAINYYINWDHTISDLITSTGNYQTVLVIQEKVGEATLEENWSLICPENMFIMIYQTSEIGTAYDIYACGNNYSQGNNTNTCSEIREYLNDKAEGISYNGRNGTIVALNFYSANAIVGNKDEQIDVQGSYDALMQEKDIVCSDSYISKNGEDDCEKIDIKINALTDENGQFAYFNEDIDDLHAKYLSNANLDFSITGECDSYLGNIYDDGGDDPRGVPSPAYILNFAFNIIKYIAIVLLFVLTVIDLIKGVADGKDETRKKIVQRLVKRIIIAVLIFFLPLLINFVLDLLGVITIDDACRVGDTAINGTLDLHS